MQRFAHCLVEAVALKAQLGKELPRNPQSGVVFQHRRELIQEKGVDDTHLHNVAVTNANSESVAEDPDATPRASIPGQSSSHRLLAFPESVILQIVFVCISRTCDLTCLCVCLYVLYFRNL